MSVVAPSAAPVAHSRSSTCTYFQQSTNSLALLITRRCNMSCGHCSVESAPRVGTLDPSEAELFQTLRDADAAGVRQIQITGGEPMLRPELAIALVREGVSRGMNLGMSSNGYWGKKPQEAFNYLKRLTDAGLTYLTISYDRYHAEFMGPQPILNIAAAAKRLSFPVNVNITRLADDTELTDYAKTFGNLPFVRMRFYDIQPLGRARGLQPGTLRTEVEGFCNAVSQATITEDRRVIACNGPAYFEPEASPLYVGDLNKAPLSELLKKHWDEPVLATLRTFGPTRLRSELEGVPGFEHYFREAYGGQCDLCHHVTSNPEAVTALREKLSSTKQQAERTAKWSIMQSARAAGELNRDYVNGPAANQLVFHAAAHGEWPDDCSRLLGRADLDWNHLIEYTVSCGLAGAISAIASRPVFARWAPGFVAPRLQQCATRDALRELAQREVLEQIGEALGALGTRGLLLKGAALRALDLQHGHMVSSRIAGDIDILPESPSAAEALRRRLIEMGFTGNSDAPRTGPHHLAPIFHHGVLVEIHTGVLPSFWGFPDSEAWRGAMPVSDIYPLFMPRAEGMLLHLGIHATTHLFSHGLKLAFDIHRVLRGYGEVDWKLLGRMANATRCPRAFWVPLRALVKGIPAVELPADFLGYSPHDQRQARLELIASKRLFTVVESPDEMNPFSRNAVFLMLYDGMWRRAGYLKELLTGPAAESRQAAMASGGGQSSAHLPDHLRQALRDWKNYRRAIRR